MCRSLPSLSGFPAAVTAGMLPHRGALRKTGLALDQDDGLLALGGGSCGLGGPPGCGPGLGWVARLGKGQSGPGQAPERPRCCGRGMRKPKAGARRGGRPGRRGGGPARSQWGAGAGGGGVKTPPGAGGRASAREEERRGGLPPRAAPRNAARRGPAGGCPPVRGLARGCPAGLCPGRGAAGGRGARRLRTGPGHAQAHGEVPKLPHRGAPG